MATNLIFDEPAISVACTHPAAPVSGGPVRLGKLTGVALVAEGEGGNIAAETTIEFGMKVWDVVVDDNQAGGIAVGDIVYYHDAGTGAGAVNLNNSVAAADAIFGVALETVANNATTLIRVLHVPTLAVA